MAKSSFSASAAAVEHTKRARNSALSAQLRTFGLHGSGCFAPRPLQLVSSKDTPA